MRIAQIVVPGASLYERKCQRVDHAALSSAHDVALVDDARGFDVAHIYGPRVLPRAPFVDFPVPYVANGIPANRRLAWRKAKEPEYVVGPVSSDDVELLPEAVEEGYFAVAPSVSEGPGGEGGAIADSAEPPPPPRPLADARGDRRVVASLARPSTPHLVDQTLARIRRFRDDVEWLTFDRPPSSAELQTVDAWVDPAIMEDDYDGFVAEALVAGLPVVASRTPINVQRLEKGRTGWLVPPGDPNELVHAILAALFKSEVAQGKISAARQTRSKFQARQRLRLLSHMYETLTR